MKKCIGWCELNLVIRYLHCKSRGTGKVNGMDNQVPCYKAVSANQQLWCVECDGYKKKR